MFSWTFQASVETEARPDQIWNQWTNVPGWPKWDDGLDWCELYGKFVPGTAGKLKPKGFYAMPFVLTEVEPGVGYSDVTKMPFTQIIFHHKMEKIGSGKIRITHRAHVRGLLAPLLKLTMGKGLKKGMPKAILKLTQMALKPEQNP